MKVSMKKCDSVIKHLLLLVLCCLGITSPISCFFSSEEYPSQSPQIQSPQKDTGRSLTTGALASSIKAIKRETDTFINKMQALPDVDAMLAMWRETSQLGPSFQWTRFSNELAVFRKKLSTLLEQDRNGTYKYLTNVTETNPVLEHLKKLEQLLRNQVQAISFDTASRNFEVSSTTKNATIDVIKNILQAVSYIDQLITGFQKKAPELRKKEEELTERARREAASRPRTQRVSISGGQGRRFIDQRSPYSDGYDSYNQYNQYNSYPSQLPYRSPNQQTQSTIQKPSSTPTSGTPSTNAKKGEPRVPRSTTTEQSRRSRNQQQSASRSISPPSFVPARRAPLTIPPEPTLPRMITSPSLTQPIPLSEPLTPATAKQLSDKVVDTLEEQLENIEDLLRPPVMMPAAGKPSTYATKPATESALPQERSMAMPTVAFQPPHTESLPPAPVTQLSSDETSAILEQTEEPELVVALPVIPTTTELTAWRPEQPTYSESAPEAQADQLHEWLQEQSPTTAQRYLKRASEISNKTMQAIDYAAELAYNLPYGKAGQKVVALLDDIAEKLASVTIGTEEEPLSLPSPEKTPLAEPAPSSWERFQAKMQSLKNYVTWAAETIESLNTNVAGPSIVTPPAQTLVSEQPPIVQKALVAQQPTVPAQPEQNLERALIPHQSYKQTQKEYTVSPQVKEILQQQKEMDMRAFLQTHEQGTSAHPTISEITVEHPTVLPPQQLSPAPRTTTPVVPAVSPPPATPSTPPSRELVVIKQPTYTPPPLKVPPISTPISTQIAKQPPVTTERTIAEQPTSLSRELIPYQSPQEVLFGSKPVEVLLDTTAPLRFKVTKQGQELLEQQTQRELEAILTSQEQHDQARRLSLVPQETEQEIKPPVLEAEPVTTLKPLPRITVPTESIPSSVSIIPLAETIRKPQEAVIIEPSGKALQTIEKTTLPIEEEKPALEVPAETTAYGRGAIVVYQGPTTSPSLFASVQRPAFMDLLKNVPQRPVQTTQQAELTIQPREQTTDLVELFRSSRPLPQPQKSSGQERIVVDINQMLKQSQIKPGEQVGLPHPADFPKTPTQQTPSAPQFNPRVNLSYQNLLKGGARQLGTVLKKTGK
jgi:hypothetical protein